ncbi:hypothetical protein IMSHALPRED_002255 [Imshaugia aleurites]|uniref:Cytochrome P450 n=1 Tax=Imshaugia aleurites TaxID=172621 RepID=A0A8H3EZN5_9LECA|nr:hypothetical protein IMSHALPRED_002255 [Imshaugia aleurites]
MLGLLKIGIFTIFWLPIVAVGIYALGVAVYRLFLSPLAKFPGPKLAALTRKYESYYEAIQNYEYVWKIKQMHQKYGPIVRISPHEIHVDDIEFFDRLNSFQGKWNKDPYTAHQFANPGSLVGTLDHDVHRKRRAAVLPFFSKQKIYALEPVITSMVDKLCEKMEDYRKSGEVLPLRNALHCFAVDVVGEYCFAESGGLLDRPKFALNTMQNHLLGLKAGLRARYLPSWYMGAVRGAPEWVRQSVDPAAKHFEVWHRDVDGPVRRMEERKNDEFFEKAGHRTIFHELINSPHLPPAEKETVRVIQEAGALVGAGGESTTQVLLTMAYCLIASPEKLARLREELRPLMPNTNSPVPSLRQLEQLPYLIGCVKEALRLRTGKIARHIRLPRDRPLYYKDWEIPAGTIVSMTPILHQIDPDVFPNPHAFLPERWMNIEEQQRIRMEHHFVPYSKGTRQCAGINLANAELYMCVPALVTRFDFELFETDDWDVDMAVDAHHHSPRVDTQSVRVFAKASTF